MMRGGALINHIEAHKMFTEREAAIVVQCVTSALKHLHGQGIFILLSQTRLMTIPLLTARTYAVS